MMKAITTVVLGSLLTIISPGDEPDEEYVPKEGFVPTKDVAIKIAVAVWEPIYGADHIADEKPYVATLDEKKNVWGVIGSEIDRSSRRLASGQPVEILPTPRKTGLIVGVIRGK